MKTRLFQRHGAILVQQRQRRRPDKHSEVLVRVPVWNAGVSNTFSNNAVRGRPGARYVRLPWRLRAEVRGRGLGPGHRHCEECDRWWV